MANALYDSFKAKIMDGSIDLDTHTIKCAMLTTAYTYSATAHSAWSNVSANEVTASGYTAGGAEITGKSVSTDTTNHRGVFDGGDVAWTAINSDQVGKIIVYKSVATAAECWLIACIDTTTGATLPVTFTGGDFTVQWTASTSGGILYIA